MRRSKRVGWSVVMLVMVAGCRPAQELVSWQHLNVAHFELDVPCVMHPLILSAPTVPAPHVAPGKVDASLCQTSHRVLTAGLQFPTSAVDGAGADAEYRLYVPWVLKQLGHGLVDGSELKAEVTAEEVLPSLPNGRGYDFVIRSGTGPLKPGATGRLLATFRGREAWFVGVVGTDAARADPVVERVMRSVHDLWPK